MNDSDSEMSACPRDCKSKIAERGMSEHREKIRILEDNKFKHYSLFFSKSGWTKVQPLDFILNLKYYP